MGEIWFVVVVLMLATYVVLDGYDFGVGALHLWVARDDTERRQVLAAVGPFWDANEVWLLASGGALLVGFPGVLAAGLSGFYLAIFLVIWTLILRAVAIEFRSHVADMLWRRFWDGVFSLASALLPVLLGAALGNVIRGLPLDHDGWFALALFTDFSGRDPVGILDWYTVLCGVFALISLSAHGAVFLLWRTTGTSGQVPARARAAALVAFTVAAAMWPAVAVATHAVNPDLLANLPRRPAGWLALALAAAGLTVVFAGLRSGRVLAAFLGSCAWIGFMLIGIAACLYPVLLRSSADPALSLDVYNSGAHEVSLRTAMIWLSVGLPLVCVWFALLFRINRRKAVAAADGEGY